MPGATFTLKVLTPDQTLVEGEASAVIVPGSEGLFTVLPGHMNLISALGEGEVEVHMPMMHPQVFHVRGGFADVGNHHCIILAEGLVAA